MEGMDRHRLTPWINKKGGSASQLYLVPVSLETVQSGNRPGRCAKIGLQHGTGESRGGRDWLWGLGGYMAT
jgi:hypothetical protein